MAGYIGSKAVNLSTTGADINGDANIDGDLSFRDNDKIKLGAGSDLQIYHDGSNSQIINAVGHLNIDNNGDDKQINLRSDDGSGGITNYIRVNGNTGAVQLYNYGATKLATTSTGIDVTGTVTADGLTVDGDVTINTAQSSNATAFTSPHLTLGASAQTNDTGFTGVTYATSTAVNYGWSAGAVRGSSGLYSAFEYRSHENSASGALKLKLSNNGDISFYEDTGTTAKFFWDASAESLGIGDAAILAPVSLETNTSGYAISLEENAGAETWQIGVDVDGDLNFYNSQLPTPQFTIDDSGKVGIGTASPDASLDVESSGDTRIRISDRRDSSYSVNDPKGGIDFYWADTSSNFPNISGSIEMQSADIYGTLSDMVFKTASNAAATEAMRIDHEGKLGIGTDSPEQRVHVQASGAIAYFRATGGTGNTGIDFGQHSNNNGYVYLRDNTSLIFGTNNAERMRIDNSGNVGIGTSSPSYTLSVVKNTTGVNAVDILNSTTGAGSSRLIVRNNSDTNGNGFQIINNANDGVVNLLNYKSTPLAFWTNATEAMRIDSNGNVLVGKTSNTFSDTGVALLSSGEIQATRTGVPMYLRRNGSDGDFVSFRKDGSTVGSIGTRSNSVYLKGSSNGAIFINANSDIRPYNGTTLANYDNIMDIGASTSRFDDVRATNGTIQTSDQNEKQQIASLTDAEITAAKAISKLFKTFKWNSAVTKKGDAARTHTGVIAQDVQQAMTDAGLDAGDYAFFISDTWWETQTDVPAVEAVDEVLDEDGNVLTEAVEAQEAYTSTDTYETADEAPEGATERTRLGIRYPELLSFIGAATEQRLASIESRLDVLEGS